MKNVCGKFNVYVIASFILFLISAVSISCKNDPANMIYPEGIFMDELNTKVEGGVVTLSAYSYYKYQDAAFYVTGEKVEAPNVFEVAFNMIEADTVLNANLNGHDVFYYRTTLTMENLPPDIQIKFNKVYRVWAKYFAAEGAIRFSQNMYHFFIQNVTGG